MSSERIAPAQLVKNPTGAELPKVRERASKFLHGTLDKDDVGFGWVRPQRFLPEQRQALASCQAWYPGVFRQMARCSAGISLEFETDCAYINIEVRPDACPRVTANVLAGAREDRAASVDAFAIEIDGRRVAAVLPDEIDQDSSLIKVNISALLAGAEEQDNQLQLLPMLETSHRVRVWLPCMRGCELGDIYGEGSFINPVPQRAELLVLGDSIAQGYCAESAADTWPSLVAREYDWDLYNQSLAAQVFQYNMLAGLNKLGDRLNPEVIIVALGTNYRREPSDERMVRKAIQVYLEGLDELYPKAKLMVMLPDVASYDAVAHSCYKQVPALIESVALKIRSKRVAEGRPALLISKTPALTQAETYDRDVHPTTEGHAKLAAFVIDEIEKLNCRCLQQFGKFGQCGSCAGAETSLEEGDTAMDELAVENNIDDAEVSEDVEPIQVAHLLRLSAVDEHNVSGEDKPAQSHKEPKPSLPHKNKRRSKTKKRKG